ncbi:MAG: hypothetical protein LC789_05675 [Actinobacteria bacterium]|nr:hypothetical protein [Actinomycetota bacterium]MCA1719777.1 hypothetical protein [Actinomycetota bacterium]
MIRKLTLAAGFGAGYVLGAKAGKERYTQIEAKFRELAGMPAVQDVTSNIADTASTIGDKAKTAVNDKVSAVSDKVSGSDSTVDLNKGTAKTGARTTPAAPMAGAAPSATAPDIPAR